jgi:hypothetical protein
MVVFQSELNLIVNMLFQLTLISHRTFKIIIIIAIFSDHYITIHIFNCRVC